MLRRIACFVLIVLLLNCAYAENNLFDHTRLSGFEGYEYDKYEDSWSYSVIFQYDYDDMMAIISFIALDLNSDSYTSNIILDMLTGIPSPDLSGAQNASKIVFIIDGTRFSISLDESSPLTLLGSQSESLINAIANAESISIKLSFGNADSVIIEEDISAYSELIEFCKNLAEVDIFDYADPDTAKAFDMLFPITVSDVDAEAKQEKASGSATVSGYPKPIILD